jgi:hypothetical protein
MEILEIGKLEAYINTEQEARVPIAYKALKAGDNGCRRGPEGRHVRAAAEARTVTMTLRYAKSRDMIWLRPYMTARRSMRGYRETRVTRCLEQ